ncbi:hypothetical protein PtA15_1A247 [Puccinia triticina]|uniref:CLASP N-terminal domain-containing protein n=1 Tax=Puccinia triticina TaxID=208348 RepID=A0ABY7C6Y9_9BASI|nr:uncharacterized protein PtA15_1A247 [Puccinia triticina]WAQ80909.1 hypothetical protein PtA15_1A247 [Puccinia triticina]
MSPTPSELRVPRFTAPEPAYSPCQQLIYVPSAPHQRTDCISKMVKKMLEEPVRITSASQCHHEFDLLKEALSIEETEDTWQNIDASLKRFTAAIRGGACEHPDDFLKRWKETEIVRGLVSAMSTERTRLSGSALDLVAATSRLGSYWDSAVPFYVPTVVKLLGRASKIYVTRATITLTSLIKGTKSLGFIPYLLDGISEKSVTIRIGCADALLCCLSEAVDDPNGSESRKPRSTIKDDLNKRLNDIENAIKIGGRDRDPKVRAIFKRIWELYEQQWPSRAASLAQPLTPTIKRYLGIGNGSTLNSSHTSQASSNGLTNREINTSRDKPPLSGHHRTGEKHVAEIPTAKTANAHTSKSIKSHNSHSALPKSGDLATLQKAIKIPLPPDDPEHREPSVTRGPARARVMSTRTKTPPEGSIHQAQSSGLAVKRSNSTMRAQRVPLPPQVDLPAGNAIGKPRTATRVPLQPIQSTGTQPGKDVAIKPPSTSVPQHQPSTKAVASNVSNEPPKASFKPTRSTSGTAQADSKPSHPPQPLPPAMQTRPLPRRAVPEPSNDKPTTVPLVTNTLNVSVRSRARKNQAEEPVPIIKQTIKVFKPTKSFSKGSSNATTTSNPLSANPNINSKSGPSTTSVSDKLTTQRSKVPIEVEQLPEALRLPALTPLPISPTPSSAHPLSSMPPSVPASQPVSQPDSPSTPGPLSSSQPVPPSTNLLPSQTPPSSELPPVLSTPMISSESRPQVDPPPVSDSVLPPGVLAPSTVAQVASSTPTDTTSTHDAIQSGPSEPVAITHRTIFHQSLPSQSTNVLAKPHPFFLSTFGTPGPKICTRLPDDLIVPMSVPLPPSPNSPFIGLSNRARVARNVDARGTARKSTKTQQPPRSRATPHRTRLNSTPAAKNGKIEANNEIGDVTTLSSPIQDDGVGGSKQLVIPEGLLVDFDHEDTIWIPRPPALHQDILQLDNDLGMTPTINEESDGEDGPQEKRQRIEAENSASSNESTLSITQRAVEPLCVPPELSKPRQHPSRRDPSMFHWDQPDLELDGDDSGEKTISCLKEEPPFLAEDVTVNEGMSFNTNFLDGIHAHNQSTPRS